MPFRRRQRQMSSSFKFDKNAFMREVQREAQKGIDQMAREQNRELERMSVTYTGRPVEEIKPALQRLFARYDGKITDPELTEWAQLISDGTKITLKPDKIRF